MSVTSATHGDLPGDGQGNWEHTGQDSREDR